MSMTKLKAALITVVVAALAVPLVMQHQTQTKLREANQVLQRRVEKLDQLAAENERLSNLVAHSAPAAAAPAATNESSREVLACAVRSAASARNKPATTPLRKTNAPSPLSSLTFQPGNDQADPRPAESRR